MGHVTLTTPIKG